MKECNGYILGCRLANIMIGGYRYGFKQLCIDFGPNVWDKLSENEQEWFKVLARDYKVHPIFQAERNGQLPSPYHFICAVFQSEHEMDLAGDLLRPGAQILNDL